jgi:hypothetical protein
MAHKREYCDNGYLEDIQLLHDILLYFLYLRKEKRFTTPRKKPLEKNKENKKNQTFPSIVFLYIYINNRLHLLSSIDTTEIHNEQSKS